MTDKANNDEQLLTALGTKAVEITGRFNEQVEAEREDGNDLFLIASAQQASVCQTLLKVTDHMTAARIIHNAAIQLLHLARENDSSSQH